MVPQITTYDGKSEPMDHMQKYTLSLVEREVSDEVLSLLFPRPRQDWFHSFKLASIRSFDKLKDKFIDYFIGSRCVKGPPWRFSSWNIVKMSHFDNGTIVSSSPPRILSS